MVLAVALAATACSPDRRGAGASPASTAGGSSHEGRRPPDAARCASLQSRYEQARSGSDRCERDDECALEPRGKLYTGLDGCSRWSRRGFDGAAADAVAEAWLGAGCAASFNVCPAPGGAAMCRGGVCREKPPPPIPEDWARVDVQEAFTLFLPPDLVETSITRSCGNGPAVRMFHGPDLDVRVEYGYELGALPLEDAGQDEAPAPRRVTRTTRPVGSHVATLLDFYTPDVSSKETAPDGSWPRYHFVRALSVEHLAAPFGSGLGMGIGMGTGPVSMAITLEGARAHEPVASHILDTLSFW
jgi:hypothetical protein